MAMYLKVKKLDIQTGDALTILLNKLDADLEGLTAGDRVWVSTFDHEYACCVVITDSEVEQGEIGFYNDIWEDVELISGSRVRVELISKSKSVDYIAKKLQGEKN
jgi:anaerobic selenocysteine-containing dehydrogenase